MKKSLLIFSSLAIVMGLTTGCSFEKKEVAEEQTEKQKIGKEIISIEDSPNYVEDDLEALNKYKIDQYKKSIEGESKKEINKEVAKNEGSTSKGNVEKAPVFKNEQAESVYNELQETKTAIDTSKEIVAKLKKESDKVVASLTEEEKNPSMVVSKEKNKEIDESLDLSKSMTEEDMLNSNEEAVIVSNTPKRADLVYVYTMEPDSEEIKMEVKTQELAFQETMLSILEEKERNYQEIYSMLD